MPSRNYIREFEKGGIYHIYNRGINKQDIFLDKRDYSTFLFYMKLYLDDPEKVREIDPQKKQSIVRKSFFEEINLLAYCLMPNHFHLMIKQNGERSISEFMRSLTINYSMYFNNRYKRVGPLFQGRFKAVLVKDDDYLIHLSRYIHMNPLGLGKDQILSSLGEYEYSSYADFLGKKNTEWLKPNIILEYFDKKKSTGFIDSSNYKEFVEEFPSGSENILGNLVLE